MKKITLALMAALALAFVIGFAGCADEPKDNNNNSSASTQTTPTTQQSTNPFIGTWISETPIEVFQDSFVKFVFKESSVNTYTSTDGNTWNLGATLSYTRTGNTFQFKWSDGSEGYSGTISNGILILEGEYAFIKQ